MNANSVTFFNENKTGFLPNDKSLLLAAWEITNPGNIGNIIRLAHNINAEKVLFLVEQPEFNHLKIKKTAGFSFEQMDWKFISSDDFFGLTGNDYEFIVLETCNGAENIYEVKLPGKAIILAGNESYGLPDIVKKADRRVFIPMPGGCRSMNISHALAVADF